MPKCPECGNVFDSSQGRNYHISVTHNIKEVALDALRSADEKPNYDNCTKITGFSAGLYEDKFGSFNDALRKAGFGPSLERNVSDEKLLDYLRTFASDGRATYDSMNERGKYSARVYEQRFDSWSKALEEAGLETYDRSGENNPSWDGGKCTNVCEFCNEEYDAYPSITGNSTFCSMSCKTEWQKEHKSRENNPMWMGGHETYRGSSWTEAKRLVRERDNGVCQNPNCVITKEDIGRKLDVHHIIPFRYFDTHEEANDTENLILLCPEHHNELDAELWSVERVNQNV